MIFSYRSIVERLPPRHTTWWIPVRLDKFFKLILGRSASYVQKPGG